MTELPVRQKGVCCEVELPRDESWAPETAAVLKALADPTRLAMVSCLCKADGPICVCDFTAAFDLSQPTISHHMGKLKAAGLVESDKLGVWACYQLRADMPPRVARLISTLVE